MNDTKDVHFLKRLGHTWFFLLYLSLPLCLPLGTSKLGSDQCNDAIRLRYVQVLGSTLSSCTICVNNSGALAAYNRP